MAAVGIPALITIFFFVSVWGYDSNSDLIWGIDNGNCRTDVITAPKAFENYCTTSSNPIVGLFATRFSLDDDIWGKGPFTGTELAKKNCYESSRVYYSVVAGTDEEPSEVAFTVGTVNPESCDYGYKVKVCYKDKV